MGDGVGQAAQRRCEDTSSSTRSSRSHPERGTPFVEVASIIASVSQAFLRIGEIAERTATSADSIRHYDRLGLLTSLTRTDGGYRLFPPSAVERVRLIRSAVRAGFTLAQLQTFLRQRDAGDAPCRKVRAAAAQILDGVDRQIAELEDTRDTLRAMLADWDTRLANTPQNQPARLLDALNDSAAPSPRPASHLKRTRR